MKNRFTQVSVWQRSWSWSQYLNQQKAEAAPISVFTKSQCFPRIKSGFKVGMKLEGVDPAHPSMFCVLSIAEVIGCRLRLHIDGYSESYDFWVNTDSAGIRPAGWCQEHHHKLHPPKGHHDKDFNWPAYLQSTDSRAAPPSLFTCGTASSGFTAGMKLEAVDKKNPGLVCVASVTAVMDDLILVHFDNWDDTYDYWCNSSSPYIHPVGWCEEQGRPLTAPWGHPNPERFVWAEYLREEESSAAPLSAFTARAPHGFQVGQRLEAVDRRNPMLIRVATVTGIQDHQLKVHYDGWPTTFDFWCDHDHCDLHPVGWCQRTGHPLEPPAGWSSLSQGACPTAGCRGVGHVRGPKYSGHHSAFGCPYSDMNLRKDFVLPDRLEGEKSVTSVPVTMLHHRRGVQVHSDFGDGVFCPLVKRRRQTDRFSRPTKSLCVKEEEEELPLTFEFAESNLQAALHQSVFLSALSPDPSRDLSLCWEQHCKLLPAVAALESRCVRHWSVQQVSDFVESLLGCEDEAKRFKHEEIDGNAFLLLTQCDIIRLMSIKLGPALKIYNAILMFKHSEDRSRPSCKDNQSQSHGQGQSHSRGQNGEGESESHMIKTT